MSNISEIKVGLKFEKKFIVKKEDSAKKQGSGSLDVLSTPRLIAFMENTASQGIEQFLSEGDTTVGTAIAVKHIAASYIGAEVKVVSEITECTAKSITFKISAYDNFGSEIEKLATATHVRAIVDKKRLLARVENKKSQNT